MQPEGQPVGGIFVLWLTRYRARRGDEVISRQVKEGVIPVRNEAGTDSQEEDEVAPCGEGTKR